MQPENTLATINSFLIILNDISYCKTTKFFHVMPSTVSDILNYTEHLTVKTLYISCNSYHLPSNMKSPYL